MKSGVRKIHGSNREAVESITFIYWMFGESIPVNVNISTTWFIRAGWALKIQPPRGCTLDLNYSPHCLQGYSYLIPLGLIKIQIRISLNNEICIGWYEFDHYKSYKPIDVHHWFFSNKYRINFLLVFQVFQLLRLDHASYLSISGWYASISLYCAFANRDNHPMHQYPNSGFSLTPQSNPSWCNHCFCLVWSPLIIVPDYLQCSGGTLFLSSCCIHPMRLRQRSYFPDWWLSFHDLQPRNPK